MAAAVGATLFAAVNISFSVNPWAAAYGWLKVLEYALLVWYIRSTKPSFRLVATALTIGGIYSSVLAFLQFALQHSVGGLFWFIGERTFDASTPDIAILSWCVSALGGGCRTVLRAYGTFPHPNVLGGYLAATLPVSVYGFIRLRAGKTERVLYGMGVLGGLVGLAVSLSRAAWIAGAAGICIVGAEAYRKKAGRRRIWMPMAVYGTVFFAIAILALSTVHITDPSVSRRVALNAAAISEFLRAPLFGVGLKNFIVLLPWADSYRGMNFLQPVHNIYLLLIAEVGLIGSGAIALGMGTLVRRYLTRLRSSAFITGQDVYMVSFAVLLLLGFADHYLVTLQQGQLLLSVFLGMVYSQSAA